MPQTSARSRFEFFFDFTVLIVVEVFNQNVTSPSDVTWVSREVWFASLLSFRSVHFPPCVWSLHSPIDGLAYIA